MLTIENSHTKASAKMCTIQHLKARQYFGTGTRSRVLSLSRVPRNSAPFRLKSVCLSGDQFCVPWMEVARRRGTFHCISRIYPRQKMLRSVHVIFKQFISQGWITHLGSVVIFHIYVSNLNEPYNSQTINQKLSETKVNKQQATTTTATKRTVLKQLKCRRLKEWW